MHNVALRTKRNNTLHVNFNTTTHGMPFIIICVIAIEYLLNVQFNVLPT